MAKIDKTGDAAIMPLHKIMMKMCGQTGYTPDAVFEGLLDYIIGYLNPSLTPQPIEGWKFKPQDTPTFHEMMQTVFRIYSEEIPRRRWYDPFGDLYMAIHAGGGGKGQFFTPPSVAQCVADVNIAGWDEPTGQPTPFGHRITIADCAAGSGRMPLAGYCSILHKMQHDWGYTPEQAEARRPYISCEDLDYNCVKMAAINMAVHGCFGEAICHDSLCEPDKVRLGYIVNESMWPFPTGIPSIRRYTDPRRFVSTRLWQQRKQQHEKEECTTDCTSTPPGTPPVHRADTPKKPTDNNGPETARHQEVSAMDRHADRDIRRTAGGYDNDRYHKLTDAQIQVQDHTSETSDIGRAEKKQPRQLTLW